MLGSPATPTSAAAPPAFDSSREAALLLLTTLGTVMVAVDSTIVILALPTMSRDLSAPLETIIWAILIYLLIAAALTTQAGRVGDLLGRSHVYNAGFAVFTVGSALCGFAPNAQILIASRAVQAIGGAVMIANAGALIAYVFPPQRRGRAFGFFVLGWSIGAILGILLGGVITTELGWRYIFFINIPIGIVATGLGIRLLPPTAPRPARFDLPGCLSFSAALALICYGAVEIAAYGATDTYVVLVLAGIALLAAFAAIELRTTDPMLELRQLKNKLLGFSLASALLQGIGYLSVIFLLTLYLQGIRGLSPLNASLLLIPGYLVGAAIGPAMGRLVDRTGPRALSTAGLAIMGVAVISYAQMGLSSWLGWIPVVSLVSGFGIGMFFPANTTAIMSQARAETYGAISGLRGTLLNVGTLFSFVLTLSIASASVPRSVAYAVFLGVRTLSGPQGQQFLGGLHVALYGSALVLAGAAAFSWARGRDAPASASWSPSSPPKTQP
jgi:EmrB/QacA subfamily drug resistance transporter